MTNNRHRCVLHERHVEPGVNGEWLVILWDVDVLGRKHSRRIESIHKTEVAAMAAMRNKRLGGAPGGGASDRKGGA